MIIEYDISCFERTLQIKFPDSYEQFKDAILKLLDQFYLNWHSTEEIEDPEERAFVEDSCLEEYMMEMLSVAFNEWEEWNSIPYGDDYEPRETLWVCDHCLMAIESREGNQATLTHGVDSTDAVESRCDWCKEIGFDTLYELV